MKIRPVGAELFHVDGQKDMTKLMVAFRNCSNALQNPLLLVHKNQLTVVKEFTAV